MPDKDKSQVQLAVQAASGGPLGQLVVELWQRTRIDWSFASDKLAGAFRDNRGLGAGERRFCAETLYGMIRNLRRIDQALIAGGLRGPAPDRERLLAYLVLEGGLAAADAARHVPDIDWSRVSAIDDHLAAIAQPVRRIALRHSLPDFVAELWVAERGEAQAEALAAALAERAPMTVRVNTLLSDRDSVLAELAELGLAAHAGQLAHDAIIVDDRTNLFALAPFQRGHFEAQDEASQLCAELVAPPPRSTVVDFCAGAGGKTLALAAALAGRGKVVSCDVDSRKLTELKKRARRAQANNIQSVVLDREPDAALPPPLEKLIGNAARVLVDAPCSGLGSLRRNPEARWRLTPGDLDRFGALQLAIARTAATLVAPGGRLIYATCTLSARENQHVVEQLLARPGGFEVISPIEVWGRARAEGWVDNSGRFLELLPSVHGTDGFFAAVLRRLPEGRS